MIDAPLIQESEAPIPVNGRGIVFLRADGVPCVRLANGEVKSMQGPPGGSGGGGFKGSKQVGYILAQDPAAGINDLYRVTDGNMGVQLVYSDGTQWINFAGVALTSGEE